MRRKFFVAFSCLFLVGCSQDENLSSQTSDTEQAVETSVELESTVGQSETTTDETTGVAQSGWNAGDVQMTYLYVNETLYVYSDQSTALFEENIPSFYPDYKCIGEAEYSSDKDIPQEEFHASHIEEGSLVYSDGVNVKVYANGSMMDMKVATQETEATEK